MALIEESDDSDYHSTSSKDLEYYKDDEYNEEDDSVDEDHEVQGEHHVPRVGLFQSEEYRPIVVTNQPNSLSIVFDQESAELTVGSMFRDKQNLIAALRHYHIRSDRSYRAERSNPTQFIAECEVQGCLWRLRAAKKKIHGMFEVTTCPEKHTCMVNEPMQDHMNISARMISSLVKPYVSYIFITGRKKYF